MMSIVPRAFTLILVVGTVASCSSHSRPAAVSQAALSALSAIQRGDCATVEAQLNGDMRSRLSAQQMCTDFHSYLAVYGDVVSHGSPKVTTIGADEVVQVPLHLTRSDGEFRVTYDGSRRIAGLYFLKPGVPL